MNDVNEMINNEIKGRKIFSGVLFAFIQLLALISPYLMGSIIDIYIPSRNWTMTAVAVLLFISIPFVSISLQTLWNYQTIKYVRKKGNDYALHVMKNLVYQDMRFFDQENLLNFCLMQARNLQDT